MTREIQQLKGIMRILVALVALATTWVALPATAKTPPDLPVWLIGQWRPDEVPGTPRPKPTPSFPMRGPTSLDWLIDRQGKLVGILHTPGFTSSGLDDISDIMEIEDGGGRLSLHRTQSGPFTPRRTITQFREASRTAASIRFDRKVGLRRHWIVLRRTGDTLEIERSVRTGAPVVERFHLRRAGEE